MMRKFTLAIFMIASILFFFVGINAFSQSNGDKTIVLLTDPGTNGGDVAQYNWLMANGFNVTKLSVTSDIDLMAPAQEDIDALNAADLVIIGRDVNSSKYDGAGQDVVDNITAPVITINPYGAQWGAPPLWFTSPEVITLSDKNIYVEVNNDPIFANSNVQGGLVNFAYKGCAFIMTPDAHNGSVLASNGGNIGIVRFSKDIPYNPSVGAKTPKSDRSVFSFQNSATSFSLTMDGQAAYYGEIRRMLGLSIEAPMVYSGKNSDRSIILLTDPGTNGGDVAQYDWLMANGFNVTKFSVTSDIDLMAPAQEDIDALNAADLIIIGRDVNSSKYDGAGQDVVDNITARVITNNPYGAQWGAPPLWFTSPEVITLSDKNIYVEVNNDPIFANSHVQGGLVNFAYKGCAFIMTPDAHNGSVLASNGGNIGIVRFSKDIPYNPSVGAKTPKSDRSVFSFQNSATSFSLTMDGQAAYYGEIRRMVGLSIEAPMEYAGNSADRSIILLTDPGTNGGDVAQYDWLMANGFNVTKFSVTSDIDLMAPAQEDIDALNAADLVIIGRDVNSSKYDGAGQDVVDNITAPVITINPYGAQWGAPPLWFTNPEVVTLSGDIYVQVNDDPIFANSEVAGDSVLFADNGCAFIMTPDAHNGSVLASNSGNIGVVRFAKDVPYNPAVDAKTPKSDRTVFSFQNGANSFSLAQGGQAAYYAEICRMTGLPITAPDHYYHNNSLTSIVLLTDPSHGNDDAQLTWLTENGFDVTRINIGNEVSLIDATQETIDMLNAADLVIVGRDAFSSAYDGNGQDLIDNISGPVITNNPYGAQWGVPQLWYPAGTVSDVTGENSWVQVDNADPIFTYTDVVGDSVLLFTSPVTKRLVGSTSTGGAHNGIIVGQIGNSDEEGLLIVRFEGGVPYNSSGSSKTPVSERAIFPFETGPGSWTLSNDGQTAYFGEIYRLLGYKVEAPAFYYANPSSVATLSGLTSSVGALDPGFSSDVTSYILAVPFGTTSVTITATTSDPNATVTGNGEITDFSSTVFITVTAEDGVSIMDYAVDILVGVDAIIDFRAAGMKLYPNPARDYVVLEGIAAGACINVINATGQLVSRAISSSDKEQLNLSNLKSGIYLMKIELNGNSYSSRFIKQ